MRIGDAAANVRWHCQRYGVGPGLRMLLGKAYTRWRFSYPGDATFDRDWDVLVILDACRVDLMQELAPRYPFLQPVETFPSLGGNTWEWMAGNFGDEFGEEMGRTAYICANPFSAEYLDPGDFGMLDEVWRYQWNEEHGTVLPGPVTDRAITVGREQHPDRLLVHYLQPHNPFIRSDASPSRDLDVFGGDTDAATVGDWVLLQRGVRTREGVWADYKDNLDLVLEQVAILRENFDADTMVVSSDHGNAIGEYWIYGHPAHIPLACVRSVPWCVTSGRDRHTYDPPSYDRSTQPRTVDDRLAALGYTQG